MFLLLFFYIVPGGACVALTSFLLPLDLIAVLEDSPALHASLLSS